MRRLGRRHLLPFAGVLSLVFPFTSHSQSIAKSDPRALAMGGAYVAVADGWAAMQWNPAGMWVSGRNEAAVSLGEVPYEAGPWIDSVRVARGLPGSTDPAEAVATLASSDAGLAGGRTLGAYLMSKRFGGAFQQITYVSETVEDLADGIQLHQAALRGREYQFSVAQPLWQGRVALGASAKLVQAQGRYQRVALDTLPPSDLTSRGLLAEARGAPVVAERNLFTVDVGLLVMATAKFRVGGVVKNINAPSLESETEPSMHLPRQIRVGGLLLPHPQVKVAFDFDVYTDIFVDGFHERRELGGGLQWEGGPVALRGGLFLDLNAVERRSTYTFGLGFSGDVLRLDVAGSWAPERDGFGWVGALAAEF